MKKLLILFFTICCWSNANSQTHTFKSGWCKLAKPMKGSVQAEIASHVCQACIAKKKNEDDAKQAENNRRDKVIADKNKADKIAWENARKAKQLEDAKNAHSGQVLINAQNNTNITINKEQLKIANNVTDKTIMIGGNVSCSGDAADPGWAFAKIFKNEKGEQILQNNKWRSTFSLSKLSVAENCLQNIGIVEFGSPRLPSPEYKKYHYDIVNSKGDYLFNDNNIRGILHINDGWLLIDGFDLNTNYLYNLFSKKTIMLKDFDISTYGGTVTDRFYPIISKSIKKTYEFRNEFAKDYILKQFPTQINEEILNSYSFVLLHSDYRAYAFESERYAWSALKDNKTILLYCMSKNGVLTTIKLK